jgi:hypothetical protein
MIFIQRYKEQDLFAVLQNYDGKICMIAKKHIPQENLKLFDLQQLQMNYCWN